MRRDRAETWIHGCVAGLLAYAAIVVLYAAGNLLLGRSPLATASELGTALFPYLGDPAGGVSVTAAIAYNGVHVVGSLLLGVAAAWLLHEIELHPGLWYPVFFAGTAATIFATVFLAQLLTEIVGALSFTSVVVANTVALLIALFYLWRTHPGLTDRIADFDRLSAR